mgnify:CR=1 FL=1
MNLLRAIYQKGIDLALCNFEGNDNILVHEFISKCQPKYLWVVIKQNLMKILRDRAEALEVVRDDGWGEKDYDRELLAKFNKQAIAAYIQEIEGQGPILND